MKTILNKVMMNQQLFRLLAPAMLVLVLAMPLGAQESSVLTDAEMDQLLAAINAEAEAQNQPVEEYNGPVINMGGGPRFDVRQFLDIGTMNSYLATRGNYSAFSGWLYPFVNSGGGTSRFNIGDNLQLGWNAWGGGFSSLGHRVVNAVDTIDQDSNGYDDYYSYASYGIQVNDFLLQYKIKLARQFYVGLGGLVGLASESFSIQQNQRSFVESAVSSITGSSDWSRSLLDTGAYLTLQFQPDPYRDFFKISLNGGFDYPIALGDWMPSAGVHKDIVAPPAAFRAMNWHVGLGLDFNL
ncbi:MAG: hypothetical protein KKI09_00250 [Spirochaetes bacterium]|nr:hypothetical protein [Spirochaetota bacterium]MBU0953828.1 hypothetical protein [Spirochaetota bacterium]